MTAYRPDRRAIGAWAAGAAFACWAPPLLAQAPGGGPASALPPGPAETDQVSPTKTDPSLRMTVPVMVNGKGPYDFVVDTGANRTVICTELAFALGLPSAGPAPLHSVAGMEMVETVSAESVQINGLAVPSGRLPVLPSNRLGAQGLLGVDGLGGRRLILNFKDHSLTITAGQPPPKREVLLIEVPARRRFGQLMIVDASVDQTPVVAFLDSGAQSTVGNLALYNRVRINAEVLAPRQETLILSATDQTAIGVVGTIPALRLGHLIIETTRGAFADLHAFEIWDLIKKPAILIGMDVLSHFEWVEMDYGRSIAGFRLDRANMPTEHKGDIGNQVIPFD